MSAWWLARSIERRCPLAIPTDQHRRVSLHPPRLEASGALMFASPTMVERAWATYAATIAFAAEPERELMSLELLEVSLFGAGISMPLRLNAALSLGSSLAGEERPR